MEEPQRLGRIPVLNAQAGPNDADGIRSDRDWDAGQCKNHASARGSLQKIAVEDSQGEQAHKGAYAAACFGYLQLHYWKLNDITLLQGRNSQQRQDGAGQLRGQKLEGKRNLIKDDGGEWNRQQQYQDRKAKLAKHGASQKGPDQPAQQNYKGDPRGEEVDPVHSENQDYQAQDDNRKPRPTRLNWSCSDLFSLVPKQKD